MSKDFNPYEWIPVQQKQVPKFPQSKRCNDDNAGDIEVITRRIERDRIDLTVNYIDWLKIGFALASALGEGGRTYYHRISFFHAKYEFNNCSKQYDHCLKGNRCGVTIRTFFYLAKSAGINIRDKD